MKDFSKEVTEIYNKVLAGGGATSDHKDVAKGSVYFAFKNRKPLKLWQIGIWHGWCWLQLYAPSLLKIIGRLGSKTRWADNQFKEFDTKVMDGNAFAAAALENGASYAVIDQRFKHKPPQTILVKDVTETLYEIGKLHRQNIKAPVIGITGSVGKTTTTHLVNAILSSKLNTAFEHGSNEIKANTIRLLNTPSGVDAIVLEMSAIERGFLEAASQIAQPDHGLITALGMAHLDTFGGMENIRLGKWELLDYVYRNHGTVYLNMNVQWLAEQKPRVPNAITYGCDPKNDIVGHMLSADPFIRIRWQPHDQKDPVDIQTKLAGEHNLNNLLGAIAIAENFGIPRAEIKSAIQAFEPVDGRSQILQWGSNTIYNEGYQCNAPSTLANLKSFASFSAARKMLILEPIGLIQPDHPVHDEIIDIVEAMALDKVLIVGTRYDRYKSRKVAEHLLNRAALKEWLLQNSVQNTHIMLNVSGFMTIKQLFEEVQPH
ncbi:MAG: Mur ligase family protein [Chloroflexota bacterium]